MGGSVDDLIAQLPPKDDPLPTTTFLRSDLRAALDRVLREYAIQSVENQALHGWRCRYPESYGNGPCSCYEELLDDLVAAVG